MTSKLRLSKAISRAGIASRRKAEELIFQGRVKVNGEVQKLPQTLIDWQIDKIMLDDEPISSEEKKLYFLLNKPPGVICSQKRISPKSKLVLDLFKEVPERLFTVGRLDKETEGLILVTNDGFFANRLAHPSSNIEKEYLVKVDEEVTDLHLKAISSGTLVEGVFVQPRSVKKVRKGTLKITLLEGKKHEVRFLIKAASLHLKNLKRIRVGPFILGTLSQGTYRELTPKEIEWVLSH